MWGKILIALLVLYTLQFHDCIGENGDKSEIDPDNFTTASSLSEDNEDSASQSTKKISSGKDNINFQLDLEKESKIAEDQESFIGNSSETDNSLSSSTDETGNVTNGAKNGTSSELSHRWSCKPFNFTDSNFSSTVIMNNETELQDLFNRMNASQGCGLIMFYSPYCEFSVEIAEIYNAVGRSYSNITVLAIDVQEAMGVAARYGVAAIPTVFFFYSGKAVAKFNRSRTLEHFQSFIKEQSGLEPNINLNITDADRSGPVQTTLIESQDYYMIFSVTFLTIFLVTRLFGSFIWMTLVRFGCYMKSLLKREKLD